MQFFPQKNGPDKYNIADIIMLKKITPILKRVRPQKLTFDKNVLRYRKRYRNCPSYRFADLTANCQSLLRK